MAIEYVSVDLKSRESANENPDRLALTAATIGQIPIGGVGWFRCAVDGSDKPVDFAIFHVSSLDVSAALEPAISKVVGCIEPVFIVLSDWQSQTAETLMAAGAAGCIDSAVSAEAAVFSIEQTLKHAVLEPTRLKTLRWFFDLDEKKLTLSPALEAYLKAAQAPELPGIERFLIALAGFSARDILSQFEHSLETQGSHRVLHRLSHPGLVDDLGQFIAQEITSISGDIGPSICGVLLADVSAKEYRTVSALRSALPEEAFLSELHHYLAGDSKRIGLSAAVCVLSIDRFEQMNVLLGRQQADELLEHVAARLKTVVSSFEDARDEGDMRAVALGRLGGAQFAIAMEGAVLIKEASGLARQILACFQAPFTLDKQRLYLDARIGISVAGVTERNADKILSRANVALYQAFKDPPGSYRVFNATHAAEAQERVILDAELRDALSQDNLFIRYMPIMDLRTGRAAGVEALVRWNHPEMGLLSPELFIPMAEESGVIADVGDWVLHHALQEFARVGPKLPSDFHLAVNVSSEQFRRGDLEQTVLNQLYAAGLDERRLTLEITETLVIENFEHARSVMSALQERGIRWSIDDFGTGFSALSYLSKLPFDEIKLDRSFVKALAQEEAGSTPSTLVDAVISIAKSHEADLVAEGIETADQAALLKARGCAYGQGYCFSEPLNIHDLVRFVEGQAG